MLTIFKLWDLKFNCIKAKHLKNVSEKSVSV